VSAPEPATTPDRATIEDVAAEAGVSAATVSRAMRDLPNVAPSTRARVRAAAERLQYRADPNASRLAAGRTRAVAVAVPVVNTWYFSEVVAAAEAVLADAGYDVLVISTPTPARRTAFVVQAGRQRRVDGVIVVDLALAPDEIDALVRSGVPGVTSGFRTGSFPSVTTDNVAIGHVATSHLLGLGHERVGLITGQAEDPLHFSVPDDRLRGYRTALEKQGLAADPALEQSGNFSVEGGREAVQSMLDLADPPTAVLALSDEMAFGAVAAIRARGLRVPEDVSVLGVDDHDLAQIMDLTTVRQPVDRQGSTAARLLIAELEGDGGGRPADVELPTELVVRGSTGPAPGCASP
jgi:LacI family repressor for deo operon, udp, cdd, tsx, nupC, and nupG